MNPVSDLFNEIESILNIFKEFELIKNQKVIESIVANLFNFMNILISNEILQSSKLFCNSELGINIKLILSFFRDWATSSPFSHSLDLTRLINNNFVQLTQIANVLAILPNATDEFSSSKELMNTFTPLSIYQIHRLSTNFTVSTNSPQPIPKSVLRIIERAYKSKKDTGGCY